MQQLWLFCIRLRTDVLWLYYTYSTGYMYIYSLKIPWKYGLGWTIQLHRDHKTSATTATQTHPHASSLPPSKPHERLSPKTKQRETSNRNQGKKCTKIDVAEPVSRNLVMFHNFCDYMLVFASWHQKTRRVKRHACREWEFVGQDCSVLNTKKFSCFKARRRCLTLCGVWPQHAIDPAITTRSENNRPSLAQFPKRTKLTSWPWMSVTGEAAVWHTCTLALIPTAIEHLPIASGIYAAKIQ